MNDCYWGGTEDQYYYEVDTGRIIGQTIPNSDYVYEAFYFDSWNNPGLGRFIDSDRARKAVEKCRRQDVEKWERMRKAWNSSPKVSDEDLLADLGQVPLRTSKKPWWKIWK